MLKYHDRTHEKKKLLFVIMPIPDPFLLIWLLFDFGLILEKYQGKSEFCFVELYGITFMCAVTTYIIGEESFYLYIFCFDFQREAASSF